MSNDPQVLHYQRRIDLSPEEDPPAVDTALDSPDPRDGRVYVLDEDLWLAAEVALATARPLLLRGRPGTGKSSFAAYLARRLGWRYYEHVCTARMQAQDILWKFDAVRRLGDAQVRRVEDPPLNDFDYVEPGVLWWGLDRESAMRRGAPSKVGDSKTRPIEPFEEMNKDRSPEHAVLLIDEIDKADPDVPNNLLVPLGSLRFRVEETGTLVPSPQSSKTDELDMSRLLVILTTNEERNLPQAFLRRCVVHWLQEPDHARLVTIAHSHFARPGIPPESHEAALFNAVATKILSLREQSRQLNLRFPSTAEFLDAVRACRSLGIQVDSATWSHLERVVLRKMEGEGSEL